MTIEGSLQGGIPAPELARRAGAQMAADVEAASTTVLRQLEAFRRGDFDTAYGYASEEIRGIFDREAFERMVRGGYPEIARSASAPVVESAAAPNGHVYLGVRIWGPNGRAVDATYELVQEGGGWRINGVVTRRGAQAI